MRRDLRALRFLPTPHSIGVRPGATLAVVCLLLAVGSPARGQEADSRSPGVSAPGGPNDWLSEDAGPGDVLYAVGSAGDLYIIENYLSEPSATLLGPLGLSIRDIAWDDEAQRLYGETTSQLYEIDLVDPVSARLIGPMGASSQNSLEFGADGTLYSWGNDSTLWEVDPATGGAIAVGGVGFNASGDLAFDATGTLYGTSDPGDTLISIDTSTGLGRAIGEIGLQDLYGFEIDRDGRAVAGSDVDGTLWEIDLGTGAPTFVGEIAGAEEFGVYGLTLARGRPCSLTLAAAEDDEVVAGESFGIRFDLHHRRARTVSAPITAWVRNSAGEVISSTAFPPRTMKPGLHLSGIVMVPLPAGTPPGDYDALVGTTGMDQGEVWSRLPFRVVEDLER